MSGTWETAEVRIGSKARSGGGAADRERVIKGKSAINAASRAGAIVGTEKKYTSANSKASVEGQHLTKVDRDTDIIKPKEVGREVGQAISARRNEMTPKMTQKDLGAKCSMSVAEIQQYETGKAAPDQQKLQRLESVLGINLRGNNIGSPKTFSKKK